ncbi:hemolysin family protein [Enemella sp. A6]|uniref:hemolysin family protein n=1 Tax=Enemella sp. A6 TaxID=3440152 RepID=UPI003EB86131
MGEVIGNIALILLFVVIGGVFAAAEMALVSLRESQVKQLATRGKRGRAVQRITDDPNLFLSAVQIGVTLMGFLSAAFGGATLANDVAPGLEKIGVPDTISNGVALVLVTIAISYVSIVLGELSAKRLAMQRAESFAMVLGPMVDGLARLARPVIWFLGISTNLVVRLLGGDPNASREEVTDEEIRAMLSGSRTLGDVERRILDDVFDAGERSLREVMVPRTEVEFLASDLPAYKAVRQVRGAPHSRYPVTGESADDVIGFVHVRDLFDPEVADRSVPVGELVRPVLNLPMTVRVLFALAEMRRRSAHLAIVRDEYGGTAGIVTMEDLFEELVGDITDEYDEPTVPVILPGDGTAEVDGLTSLEDFADQFNLVLEEGPYDTVAGWFMALQGKLPALGDEVEATLATVSDREVLKRVHWTVIEMDGRRAARFRMQRGEGSVGND